MSLINLFSFLTILSYSVIKSKYYLDRFPRRALYFVSLNGHPLDNKVNTSLPFYVFNQTHDTSFAFLKVEDIRYKRNKTERNHISIFFNHLYSKIIVCLDKTNTSIFPTLKQRVLEVCPISSYNNYHNHSYTEVSDDDNFCIERLEYIDNKTNLEEKSPDLLQNYFYNMIHETRRYSPMVGIEKLIDSSPKLIYEELKVIFQKYFPTDDNISFELVFFYDVEDTFFKLNKAFVYYMTLDDKKKVTFPKFPPRYFENIFIHDKKTNQMVKYTEFYIKTRKEKYSLKEYNKTSYLSNTDFDIKINTNKKDSIYHNSMEIILNENIINQYMQKYNISSEKQEMCYLIHEILTEDVYIEKNEFKNLVKDHFEGTNINFELYASSFIEQELSSELSPQAYFSFYFCANKEQMKKINYIIKFPIHFRYQPSVNKDSNSTHHTAIMPHPYFRILPKGTYEKLFIEKVLYKYNVYNKTDHRGNERAIFNDEVVMKLNTIIPEMKILRDNYEQLKHKIPAGQMKYFALITIVTSVTSVVGFLLILIGLFKYISNKAIRSKEEKVKKD